MKQLAKKMKHGASKIWRKWHNNAKQEHSTTYGSTSSTISVATQQREMNGPTTLAWPSQLSKDGIVLDLEPLYKILEREDVRELPVVIVSANGDTRQGKSFLMNQAVKCLKYRNLSDPNDHTWIHRNLDACFEWSYNMPSVTWGISIWSEPLFCFDSQGNQLCVILVDNQGLNGIQNRHTEEFKLYALSNLISSLFIYFNRSEGRACLESLNDFCEFSRALEFDGRNDKNEPRYQFGNLLIRLTDFAWPEFPLEDGCCFYDQHNTDKRIKSQDLYDSYFRSDGKLNETFKTKRTQILESFESVIIATTSPFGTRLPITLNPPTTEGNTWTAEFQAGLIKFVERVFSYEFLEKAKKRINGQTVKGYQLVQVIKVWEKNLTNPDYDIIDMTKVDSAAKHYFDALIKKSKKRFEKKI